MTAPLKHVLVAHARDAFQSQENLSRNWKRFGYRFQPDFRAACLESDSFITLLEACGATVDCLPASYCVGLDSLYVHDPVIRLAGGFITCRMGKDLRHGEPSATGMWLQENGFQVRGAIGGDGKLEGGDVLWLRPDLPAVGLGYRSNEEGIKQMEALCADSISGIVRVALPHWNGPSDVLHLMSIVSPLSDKTLLIYSRLMPVITRNLLLDMEYELIEVPEKEFLELGCNVLALGNGKCLLEEKNRRTASLLSRKGFDVWTYCGEHISRAGEGGPTCLTRPLLRG